jgi:alpha 1,3-glucosidase
VLPKNEPGFSIDDQYYVGASGLLVKPITEASVTETTIYIGEDQVGEPPLRDCVAGI